MEQLWILNIRAISSAKRFGATATFDQTGSTLEITLVQSGSGSTPPENQMGPGSARESSGSTVPSPLQRQELFSFIGAARRGDGLILCDGARIITGAAKLIGEPQESAQNISIQLRWFLERTIVQLNQALIPESEAAVSVSGRASIISFLEGFGERFLHDYVEFLYPPAKQHAAPPRMSSRGLGMPTADAGGGAMASSAPAYAPDETRVYAEAAPLLSDPGEVIDLFYGTNRTNSGKLEFNARYTAEYGAMLYGICRVNIPPGHVRGEMERPKWWKARFQESADKDVMVVGLDQLDAAAFFSAFSSRLGEREGKEALLFIHGYNVEFEECAWRTAQLAHDLSFPGVSAFYSWPSSGNVPGYVHDEQIAKNCVPHLQAFIKEILRTPGIQKLHLIAHSMGTYILTNSLKNLVDDATIKKELDLIHQVILCAPDIDRTEFEEQIYPKFVQLNGRRTVYASDNDKALKASQQIRLGLPRLGESGSNLFVAPRIDTIDATNVRTDLLGHGYFASTKALILDIYNLVRNELDPLRRNLASRRTKGGLTYWLFPE
jgi:esterase/lipase superfamily enzyme